MTTVAGVVTMDRDLPDFSAHQIIIDPAVEGGLVRLIDLKNTLAAREVDEGSWEAYRPSPLSALTFNEVLTRQVFSIPQLNIPAGEIALVKTPLPDTPEGQCSYALFGFVKGTDHDLQLICNRVFEAQLQEPGPLDHHAMHTGLSHDTGIEAKHKMGNHILQVMHQPLWGFGETKYGMTSLMTINEYDKYRRNRQHLIDHGKNGPEVEGRVDSEYVRYLRTFTKLGGDLLPWQSQEQIKHVEQLSAQAIRTITDEEFSPAP
ncbi:hypothetical protein [Pseudomonas serbica]|uniref:hypothetical protein n=1 Tax=Pseudomonas serbica TaxID=2965074 RepID=UPI00237B174A|nr:hypothetical protein [Pseudomonas serbica]